MEDDIKAIMDFIDFCIDRDEDTKQTLELMFMYYMRSKATKT